ncbi:unnamed protein product (mitochondrion) [Plasmodiophora brassicae]|uniref:Uncharacterized protein n=2 Tax=Plasmodiophora brassicae TaxID=37360 RepID=A0A3P3YLL3_PLABS|nr:unnamed protein product [Plasmodiophora brassicae]
MGSPTTCITCLDLARLQWRRWSIGDLVMSRCRVDNLVVSGYVRPRTHRAAWTNLSCGECRFVIAAVPGHHDRVDLNHFQADDAIVVVVNLTRTDDHRPRCFSLVTSPKRNHMRDCTSADD